MLAAPLVRFGLIGYGAWSRCHARAIQSTPGCELTAVCAATDTSRHAAAADTGAAVFPSLPDLLAGADVDVVDIVTPNYLHEEMACAAFAAGKHVLLEKPMATTVAACDRIIDAAKKSACLLLVGHEMRFSGMYAEMHRLVDTGALGDVRYVLIDLWRRPYRSGSQGWRLDPARVGNWTLEEPVHFFDIAHWYLERNGEPVSIFAYGNRSEPAAPADFNTCDNFTALVRYANGSYAALSQSLAAVEHHLSIRIFGSRACLRAEWHAEIDRSERPAHSLEVSENGSMRPVPVHSTPGELFELQQEIAAMVGAVRNDAPLPMQPEDGRRAVRLCLEARRSLETAQAGSLQPAAGSL